MKKVFRKIMKLSGTLLLAFMLSVCVVMGVAPVIPKRKEQYAIEMTVEQADKKEDVSKKQVQYREVSPE
jgi:uncharacterized membrane protein